MINARCTRLTKIDEHTSRRVDVNWDKFTGQCVTIRRHKTQWGSEAKEKTRGMWEIRAVFSAFPRLIFPLPGLPEKSRESSIS
jgi:hypothetical protein